MNSEFDKFESYTTKADSSLMMQMETSCQESMTLIRQRYGPFDPEEISFFKRRLADNGQIKINSLQKMLVFNLFYKYFQDSQALNCINLDDYITLILAARKILEENGMYLLGAIVASKVIRLASRKSVNKKEMTKKLRSRFSVLLQLYLALILSSLTFRILILMARKLLSLQRLLLKKYLCMSV